MFAETWRVSSGSITVQKSSVALGQEWEDLDQTPYSPSDQKLDERGRAVCSFLRDIHRKQFFYYIHPRPNEMDTASLTEVLPQPEPRNEALQIDLQEGFYEASFPEEDTEENMVIRFAPPESFAVELVIESVTEGKPKFIYETEES
jgi:hypothetical protein